MERKREPDNLRGRLDTSVEPFVPGHIDFKYDTDKYGGNPPPDAEYFPCVYDAQVIVASGDDLSGQWKSIADSFLSVDIQYGYSDFLGLVNCNAATRKALYAAGLELPTFPAEKLPPDSMRATHPDIPDSIQDFLKGTSDGYPNILAPGLLPETESISYLAWVLSGGITRWWNDFWDNRVEDLLPKLIDLSNHLRNLGDRLKNIFKGDDDTVDRTDEAPDGDGDSPDLEPPATKEEPSGNDDVPPASRDEPSNPEPSDPGTNPEVIAPPARWR